MKYYLIKQWFPARGQTEEDYSCAFCGSYIAPKPLEEVRYYYTSIKAAERYAAKLRETARSSKYAVFEIPASCVVGKLSERGVRA